MLPTITIRARMLRTTILRVPPFFGGGAVSGAGASTFFSTLSGLLILLPSVVPGVLRCVGFRNQGADLAGGPRQVEAGLGLVGQGVDARVAGRGQRGLGVVDLDRRRDAGLEAVARLLEFVLGEAHALVGQLDAAPGVRPLEEGLAHLLLDLALGVLLLEQELLLLWAGLGHSGLDAMTGEERHADHGADRAAPLHVAQPVAALGALRLGSQGGE